MTARVGYSWNMDAILRDIDVGRAHAVAIHAASLVDHENRAAHIWFFFLFLLTFIATILIFTIHIHTLITILKQLLTLLTALRSLFFHI